MKKFLVCLFSLMVFIILTGCENNPSSEKDIKKLFAALKQENIISDSMEQIDVQSYTYYPLEWCVTDHYYIYKDNDSKMIAVTYKKNRYSEDAKYNHVVTVYYDVTINNDVNTISADDASCDETYYTYQNGEYTDKNRYELGSEKVYHAVEKSSFLKGKYYSLELAS